MKTESNISPTTINLESGNEVLSIKNVFKSFGDNHVLSGLNLTLHKKENLVVLGRSGSGKSVLIKCVIGLIPIESGIIKVFGNDVTSLTRKQLDEMRTKVGFVFQGNALYDSMTVKENLEFALKRLVKNISKKNIEMLVDEMLENVSLPLTKNIMPAELSGGMKKRIGLARTLIMKPEIMLYDEPTTGLDPVTSKEISNLILNIQDKYQTSSMIITHDISCAKITSNKIITLINGINYAEGSYEELTRSEDPLVKAFFK
ncbi:MAG: ATP-binding cassette domain-containing protein [Bacteroidota bacterium]